MHANYREFFLMLIMTYDGSYENYDRIVISNAFGITGNLNTEPFDTARRLLYQVKPRFDGDNTFKSYIWPRLPL